jgi:hypothetical protein
LRLATIRAVAVLLALAIAVVNPACSRPKPTRWCALVIKHQLADYDCPFSFYVRWDHESDFGRTTLQYNEVRHYSVSCNIGCDDATLQVIYDTSGSTGTRAKLYSLACTPSGSEDGPAAKYVFYFKGVDPVLAGTVDSPFDPRFRYAVEKGPVFHFTHPTQMRKPSGPLPELPFDQHPGAQKMKRCNPW